MKIGKNGAWHKPKARAILGYTENKELYAIFP
jgi:murein tripeptide amidase MpaA